ncbi:hypothetical protein C8Q78DRAFT_1051133 [Trametes maxima]|nr:hypothetical protein C8Q78DRAFT_1051133 [Trametes maxima]
MHNGSDGARGRVTPTPSVRVLSPTTEWARGREKAIPRGGCSRSRTRELEGRGGG